MKISLNIPIVGWASATVDLPEDWEDASDAEIREALKTGELELGDFMIEQTSPVDHLRDGEAEALSSDFPEELEINR